MSRVVVHDPRHACDGRAALRSTAAHEWIVCRDRESLLSALSERRPDLLIHVLDDVGRDLEILSTLRRVAPRLPFVLLGEPASLETRRIMQDLRPTYFGVLPLDDHELSEAVEGVLGPADRRAPPGGPPPDVPSGDRTS